MDNCSANRGSRFASISLDDYALTPSQCERVVTPALAIYLPHVRENIRRVLALLGGDPDRWRPHIKTVKIAAVLKEYALAGLRQFKAATVKEARLLSRVLAENSVESADILIAYPLVGPSVRLLESLANEYPKFRYSMLCEGSAAAEESDDAIGLFIDLNSGMGRTGVPEERWQQVWDELQPHRARLRGWHFYDGHIHGENAEERRDQAHAGYRRLLDWIESLSDVASMELITSGTPAFLSALSFEPFHSIKHRVSPGTVAYHDLRSEQELNDLDLVPAAVVLARVVSHPDAGRVTCDTGSKSIAAEAGDPCAFVMGQAAWNPLTPSEEHLPIDLCGEAVPERGTLIYLVPRHVCPTVNLAEQALLIDESGLSVVPVEARAHDPVLVDALLPGDGKSESL